MIFDWVQFLNERDIEYVTSGRNLSKGNIAIHCPMCGPDDPSHHLNISLTGRGWRCWRNADHGSVSSTKLVSLLTGLPWNEAAKLTGSAEAPLPHGDAYMDAWRQLYPQLLSDLPKLKVPKDWRPIHKATGPSALLIWSYLRQRGYSQHDASQMALRFNLQYSLLQGWSKRIIFPIYNERGDLVNYTGRAVSDRATLRYKTTHGEAAVQRMSECVLDLPRLIKTKGKVLVIEEGPFDVLRTSWIGEPLGVYATCIFTQNVSDVQAAILNRLADNFDRMIILFDNQAYFHGLKAQQILPYASVDCLPTGVKDPGELKPNQLLALCRDWCGMGSM